MAVQFLYSTTDAVVKQACLTKKTALQWLWALDVPKDKLITAADLATLRAVSGTRQTLIDVIGGLEALHELFCDES